MSANTFFNFATWINTEIQSAQLSRTNSILQTQLSGAASILQDQAAQNSEALENEKEIESLREIVFTTKKQLSEILKIVDEKPLEGLVFYLNSRQAFGYIKPSFFPSFADKEYVDQVKELVSELESIVHQQYDSDLITSLPQYPIIDSIYADIRYRRFFVKGKELANDRRNRGFMGVKKSFLQDLGSYCEKHYSDAFWNIYIRYDNPMQAEGAVNHRLNRLASQEGKLRSRFSILEDISIIDSGENVFDMTSDQLGVVETSIVGWLQEKRIKADSVGLSLAEPGTTWEERIQSDLAQKERNRMK